MTAANPSIRPFRRFRPLRRRAAALLLALGVAASGAGAAEPSLRVVDGGAGSNYDAFLGQVTDLIAGEAARAAASTGGGGTFYIDLNMPLGDGLAGRDTGDQALARAAKATYDLYRALGGDRLDSAAFFERSGNRFYVGLDGEGGRWLATPEEALASLVDQIQAYQFRFSRGGEGGVNCPLDFRCLLKATYQGALETSAYAPRDTTVTLELTGDGFVLNGGPPVLKTPAGLVVHAVTFIDAETIRARVSVTGDAALGLNALYVFNEGTAFRAVGAYGLHVVASAAALEALVQELLSGSAEVADADPATDAGPPALPADYDGPALLAGTGEIEWLADDVAGDPANAAVLPLGATLAGRLEIAGDEDLFRIDIPTPGTLTLASAGPTDLTGRLEDGDGTVLLADDDGGPRYNFRLEGALPAGSYYLRVGHCCAGAGSYRLTGTLTADEPG
jgi:hypothetical protein